MAVYIKLYNPVTGFVLTSDDLGEDVDSVYSTLDQVMKNPTAAYMQIIAGGHLVFVQPEIYKQCLITLIETQDKEE